MVRKDKVPVTGILNVTFVHCEPMGNSRYNVTLSFKGSVSNNHPTEKITLTYLFLHIQDSKMFTDISFPESMIIKAFHNMQAGESQSFGPFLFSLQTKVMGPEQCKQLTGSAEPVFRQENILALLGYEFMDTSISSIREMNLTWPPALEPEEHKEVPVQIVCVCPGGEVSDLSGGGIGMLRAEGEKPPWWMNGLNSDTDDGWWLCQPKSEIRGLPLIDNQGKRTQLWKWHGPYLTSSEAEQQASYL